MQKVYVNMQSLAYCKFYIVAFETYMFTLKYNDSFFCHRAEQIVAFKEI